MDCLFQKRKMLTVSSCLGLALLISSCAYLQGAAKQSEYSNIQETDPSQRNLKHMIDRQTFFVYGRILDATESFAGLPIAVLAFSSRYKSNELVDLTHISRTGTQYGLHLPEGLYDLIVIADQDQNGVLDETEVVGRRHIELGVETHPEMVASRVDIQLSGQESVDWNVGIAVPEVGQLRESVFFPNGSIRSLDDSLFDSDIAALGMYEPAAFLEIAPTMFYALEEDSYKIPVVFVHGIGGSPREFAAIVDRLDRERYKPWFFFYPSGSDLDQLADFFYDIFLSGKAAPLRSNPVIIVAHSMGGLVVREVLDKYSGSEHENRVKLFISIASPMGGHPDAAAGERHGSLVLPSWRDLNPNSPFINGLFRKPLPPHVDYRLLYTYGNPGSFKLGENSDGVVPLSSQLRHEAQRQSTEQFGFNSSHTDVLKDGEAIAYIVESIRQVKGLYPESHLKVMIAGGYDIELDERYSDREKHFIHKRGKYMASLASGELDSLGDPLLEHFVKVSQGRAEPETDAEAAWLKFSEDYPQYEQIR